MDFLRRLFGGGQGSAPPDEPVPTTPDTAADPAPATPDPTPSASGTADVAWHKVDAATSTYRGEVDGVHVATIAKLPPEVANGAAWEWRLEVPVDGERVGHAKRLKDAKPAVEDALATRQA